MHMITHTSDRPHNCSLCEKSFSDPSYLQREFLKPGFHAVYRLKPGFLGLFIVSKHIKRHAGVKPYNVYNM